MENLYVHSILKNRREYIHLTKSNKTVIFVRKKNSKFLLNNFWKITFLLEKALYFLGKERGFRCFGSNCGNGNIGNFQVDISSSFSADAGFSSSSLRSFFLVSSSSSLLNFSSYCADSTRGWADPGVLRVIIQVLLRILLASRVVLEDVWINLYSRIRHQIKTRWWVQKQQHRLWHRKGQQKGRLYQFLVHLNLPSSSLCSASNTLAVTT